MATGMWSPSRPGRCRCARGLGRSWRHLSGLLLIVDKRGGDGKGKGPAHGMEGRVLSERVEVAAGNMDQAYDADDKTPGVYSGD